MAEMDDLLKQADELGIIKIDLNGAMSPEIMKVAIEATRDLDSRLDKAKIKAKFQKVDSTLESAAI